MLMKYMFMLVTLYSLSALATKPQCDDGPVTEVKQMMEVAKMAGECPNASKITSLCSEVSFREKDPNPLSKKYKYLYQRKILEASCAEVGKDSEAEVAKKVATMWKKFESELHCSNTQFDVSKGSLIKFAVAQSFDTFIYDVTDWKIDLNKVDASDQRTVLDYVRDQKTRLKGTALEETMQEYYEVLREAGAKHKSEL